MRTKLNVGMDQTPPNWKVHPKSNRTGRCTLKTEELLLHWRCVTFPCVRPTLEHARVVWANLLCTFNDMLERFQGGSENSPDHTWCGTRHGGQQWRGPKTTCLAHAGLSLKASPCPLAERVQQLLEQLQITFLIPCSTREGYHMSTYQHSGGTHTDFFLYLLISPVPTLKSPGKGLYVHEFNFKEYPRQYYKCHPIIFIMPYSQLFFSFLIE